VPRVGLSGRNGRTVAPEWKQRCGTCAVVAAARRTGRRHTSRREIRRLFRFFFFIFVTPGTIFHFHPTRNTRHGSNSPGRLLCLLYRSDQRRFAVLQYAAISTAVGWGLDCDLHDEFGWAAAAGSRGCGAVHASSKRGRPLAAAGPPRTRRRTGKEGALINIALLLCGMCHWQRRVAAGNPPRLSRARLDVIAGVDRAGSYCVVLWLGAGTSDPGWSGTGPATCEQKPVRLWRLGG
jgi:hypothetical protein